MATLAFLVAACLDPVQAALVLAILVAYRGSQPIMLAGVVAAVVSETVMMLAVSGYVWGELIAPRVVAALLQAAVLFWCVSIVRSAARSASAALGGSRLSSSGGTASLEAQTIDAQGSRPGRLAAWRIGSHARRYFMGLLKRKLQP
jgi:type VI protein secretion system component VasK